MSHPRRTRVYRITSGLIPVKQFLKPVEDCSSDANRPFAACAMILHELPRKSRAETSLAAGTTAQRVRVVEEYAALDRIVEEFRPHQLRYERLRRTILDWYKATPADAEIHVPGKSCDLLITGRDKQRAVTTAGKRKLFKLWGIEGFIARCALHLKTLPDPQDEAGLYTEQSSTGPRHLKVVARVMKAAESTAA